MSVHETLETLNFLQAYTQDDRMQQVTRSHDIVGLDDLEWTKTTTSNYR